MLVAFVYRDGAYTSFALHGGFCFGYAGSLNFCLRDRPFEAELFCLFFEATVSEGILPFSYIGNLRAPGSES
jgi:hypothetical protein